MSQFTTDSQHTLETSCGPVRYWDHGPGTARQHRCITVDWPFGAHRQPMAPDAAARRFADFAQPVLVVWAGQDRLFPHGRFELVDDSAPFIPYDQPHSLAAILTDFLAPDAAR